jgi:electron transfer flavoprotein alpha subunit
MSGTAVLVLVEHDGLAPLPSSEEALTLARDLAAGLGSPLAALLIGDGAGLVATGLGAHGVESAHVVGAPELATYTPAAWAGVLAGMTRERAPRVVIGPGTTRGHEVLAGAAARVGAPFAAGCLEARAGDPITVTRQRWAGSVLEEAELHGDMAFLAVAELAVEPRAATTAVAIRVEPRAGDVSRADLRVRLVETVRATSGRISLADARVVVGGGRGVGGSEGFAQLEDLAALLGGTVGVSRVVTSAGWRPHADQVGQTGTRIAPDLYIACGISGAIQHIVGCRAAKAILAINTDPDAPIMTRATWAVIGDLHAVVPAISAEIRRREDSTASR